MYLVEFPDIHLQKINKEIQVLSLLRWVADISIPIISEKRAAFICNVFNESLISDDESSAFYRNVRN
jgi:hypothetical protein